MPRWPRPPNLLRLLVGQHIINGASVGLGVIAVARGDQALCFDSGTDEGSGGLAA